MESKDIVVGGIYEYHHPHYKHIPGVVVIKIYEGNQRALVSIYSTSDHFDAELEYFGEQIGYDARKSDMYQEMETRYMELIDYKSSLSSLSRNYDKLTAGHRLAIEEMIHLLQVDIEILDKRSNALVSNESWFNAPEYAPPSRDKIE